MRSKHPARNGSQRGIALLIAIFALLLISGAAIGMVVMSGMESAINANYRRSTITFYHGSGGLEEARERMVPCSPNSFWPVTACANPPVSADPLFNDNPANPSVQVLYVINPNAAQGDPAVFNPQAMPQNDPLRDANIPNNYQNVPIPPGIMVPSSAMATAGNQPPLDYKWVRIALKTEFMAGMDLDNSGGNLDETMAVRVDGNGRQCLPTMPGCAFDPNAPITTKPVYRVTASAVSPTGERRLLEAEMSQLPVINPNGAIASQAGVSIQGNFNAFGAWPPIVKGSCPGLGKNVDTCGTMSKGAVTPDCTQPFADGGTPNDPTDDTCGGRPRPYGDYCNQASAANAVSSAGNIIPNGNYSQSPDVSSSCGTTGSGCISTVSPNSATSDNMANWPYNMSQIIDMLRPPVTKPLQTVDTNAACTTYDPNGNRVCNSQNIQYGTLPSPFPPAPGTQPNVTNQELVFADVGPGGVLKISGSNSKGSGILVVEGDLEVTGGLEWYGLIVVRGTVKFLGGGSAGVNVIGGILAGSSVTNVAQNTTTGGSVAITYSSCAFRYNNQAMPLRYLSFREVTQ